MRQSALEEHMKACFTPLDTEVFANRLPRQPSMLRFHPYDDRLAIADGVGIGYGIYSRYTYILPTLLM